MQILEKDIHVLRQIVTKYPYFSMAQLALARMCREADEIDLDVMLQRAGVHFSNHTWLNYLLNADELLPAKAESKASGNQPTAEEAFVEARLSQMLSQQVAGFNKPMTGEEKLFAGAEPLFKIDYFKHQGIEANDSETKLGHKVRRFTDWLKEMKKLDAAVPQFNTSESEEKAAALQALHSLDNSEVFTEPMAEVLLLQGKKQQAIDIYKKLSLSNPEKSIYFASKIAFLKENKS